MRAKSERRPPSELDKTHKQFLQEEKKKDRLNRANKPTKIKKSLKSGVIN